MATDFVTWVNDELDNRGWSQAELARRGGFTPAALSKILSRERMVGVDVCRGIAKAFNMQDVEVMRLAGLANPERGEHKDDPAKRELLTDYDSLNEDDRERVIEFIRGIKLLRGQAARRRKAAGDS